MNRFLSLILLWAIIPLSWVSAQSLLSTDPIKLLLQDSTEVTLFAKTDIDGLYYVYLPTNLRLSIRNDSIPEMSFMTFREHENAPISGGLMHILLTWGLTNAQQAEATDILRETWDSTAVIRRCIALAPHPQHRSLNIVSTKETGRILRDSKTSSGGTPLFPGSKLASSFYFKADNAVKIESAFNDRSLFKDVIIRLDFIIDEVGFRSSEIYIENSLMNILKIFKNT